MNRKIELLAPGGDLDSIKAAILAGADAIYCGLDRFNARNTAANISFEELQAVLRLAHKKDCRVFLTLNIIIVETEIPSLIALLNKLINTTIDGIIVQDLGLLYILSAYYKDFNIHASTQLTTHNEGQILFLSKLSANRVNLSRELNIDEIKAITKVAHPNKMMTEVFVHGSNCISFSGLCYMSSVLGGMSGNRGRCSQPCRDRYETTALAKNFPLNLKDNSAYADLKQLKETGVDALKIEGRIKKSDYVYTVVNAWKKQIRSFSTENGIMYDKSELYKVFNRDFSDAFLMGEIHKDMFIDNPRDHSIQHLAEINPNLEVHTTIASQMALYDEKEKMKVRIDNEIKSLSMTKAPLSILISGECGKPLHLTVKTPEDSFVLLSAMNLTNCGTEALNYEMLFKRLKAVNDTEFFIEQMNLENLQPDLYLPFKELTSLKKQILYILNAGRETIAPIVLPLLPKHLKLKTKAHLAVFISSPEDARLSKETDVTIYFQLPESLKKLAATFIALFREYETLIPCFPSILIGEDYTAAIAFLEELKPRLIVSNNTGIAFEAWNRGIPWIAGPYMNLVNSYSLLCLKEKFNCSGAFISNEINKSQLLRIHQPEDFMLFYSIFHPILLMTSRQCLFHQITGCEKNSIDEGCIQDCEKSANLMNLKKQTFFVEKTKGNHHRLFHEMHFMNTAIPSEIPDLFTGFSIDISDVKTATIIETDHSGIIPLFENLLNGISDAKEQLSQKIHPTTQAQYIKGI